MDSKKKKTIIGFLGLTLVIALLLMSGCGKGSINSSKKTDVRTQTQPVISDMKDKKVVSFYNSDGIIIDRKVVEKKSSVETPTNNYVKEGYVFSGWSVKNSKDGKETENDITIINDSTGQNSVSGNINSTGGTTLPYNSTEGRTAENGNNTENTANSTVISTNVNKENSGNDMTLPNDLSDIDFVPNYEDISKKKNVFAIPAVYGKSGGSVSAKLQLCGQVDLCALDIQVTYNPELLEFTGFDNEDAGIVANCDKKNGVIRINLINTVNINGDIDLCDMKFKILSKTPETAILTIKPIEIIKLGSNKDFIASEYYLVNGKIYISN